MAKIAVKQPDPPADEVPVEIIADALVAIRARRMPRTHYTVRYGRADKVARFSDYFDAMGFAEQMSLKHSALAEVGHKTGLVGQYKNGVTTPEFAAHHATRTNGH